MKTSLNIREEWTKNRSTKSRRKAHWTEITQLVFSAFSIIGVIFLIMQINQVERAIRGETYSKIYDQEFTLFNYLLIDSTYYDYLYEGEIALPGTPEYKKVTQLVTLFADFFENICLQTENLDKEVKAAWEKWMFSMYESTPMLRQHFQKKGDNYSPQCMNMIREFNRKIQMVNKK